MRIPISICQMSVVPGHPDLNAQYMIREIKNASERGVEIIIFPEMATTGYLIGDVFEDSYFIADVERWNKKIIKETPKGITAIFGTVVSAPEKRGEDGRQRLHNCAIAASGGEMLYKTEKSLQPNYRFFNDDKHFYSKRKIAEEEGEVLHNLLESFTTKTSRGEVRIGLIICEDMWHLDYAFNPAKTLAEKGAEIIISISASPWTWQKNRKRHQVVKKLLKKCGVPFIYANNTGCQNTGKNIIIFDGSSAIYGKDGRVVFEIPPYESGSHDFLLKENTPKIPRKQKNDAEELYAAMICATKSITPNDKKILVGLSGGIDSAVVLAHMVDVLGPEKLLAINMPFKNYNSFATKSMAATIAKNLGVEYQIIPITEIVEGIAKSAGVKPDTLAYENIQARARMEVLAAKAQELGGMFVCNSNKTEIAFGYGTLYGDIAGYYAPLGDVIKRLVRELALHINNHRFKQEVIPKKCIGQTPAAELAPGQKDPFDYGDFKRRGYHDEMIRAFTEFRKNPEWFVRLYFKGELENELMLEPGTLKNLFPSPENFIKDLERLWEAFHWSFFKRVQCPPIPIFSKRAFGRDLEESIMPAHYTEKYKRIKLLLLGDKCGQCGTLDVPRKRVVVFGGSFNPPANHHATIARRLFKEFDTIILTPCGIRKDKPSIALVSPKHRKEMMFIAFGNIPEIEFDFYDLDNNTFTPTCELARRYKKRFPNAEIWFAVGVDLILGGKNGTSEIQQFWKNGRRVWRQLKFAVISDPNCLVKQNDVPPNSKIVNMKRLTGRSSKIRELTRQKKSIENLVPSAIEKYIKKNKLYESPL